MPKKASLIVVLVLALIVSVTTYAFAAANDVPATNAGDGSKVISGYSITAVSYTLDAVSGDPSKIVGMTFTATPTDGSTNYAKSVTVRLSPTGTWYSCTVSGNTSVTCSGMNVSVTSATNLQIVAAQ